jgi:hypothetical protein
MAKSFAELLLDLRAQPRDVGVMENVMDDLLTGDRGLRDETLYDLEEFLRQVREDARDKPRAVSAIYDYLVEVVSNRAARPAPVIIPPPLGNAFAEYDFEGGRRRKSQTKRFGSCVKAVRKTVRARKGSTAEGAAIAICTTTLLHPRGRTLKRYRKGRLLTQKRRRSS